MLNSIKINMLILCLLLFPILANTQTRISSPYSRYGIGELQKVRYGQNLGLSGLSSGFRSNSTVNYINSASYTAFDTTSFVFDVGLNSYFTSLQTDITSEYHNYTSLAYLLFGFPVTKWWGSSFGLVPYSNVGYKIANAEIKDSIGNINYLYEGQGGINRFYWGNSFKIFKGLSVGFNASLLFGSLDRIRTAQFTDSAKIYDAKIKNYTIVNDIQIDLGIQYERQISSNLNLCIGGTFNIPTKLKSKQNILAERLTIGSTGYEVIEDTVYNVTDKKGNITLPANISGGFVLKNNEKWLAGADISWQNWANFDSFGIKDSLKNSLQICVAYAYTPSNSSIAPYFKKVQYRTGIHYDKSYLQLKNTQINEFSISFGLGFPLKRSKSFINFGIELGQKGTVKNNLVKEQYGKITLGLSIYERWFLRKKYN